MSARRRRGAGLVELLVALAISGIVAAAVAGTLARQQRFFAAASQVVGARIQLRDATSLLPSELRGISPSSGDVIAFSDSSVELRAGVGAGVACDVVHDPSGAAIYLAPEETAAATLGALTSFPQPGDVALIYDEGDTDSLGNDVWRELAIVGASRAEGACAGSPLLVARSAGDAPPLRVDITAGATLPVSVRPGAFVRLLRRARYRLYRGATGEWYLGYAEWTATGYGGTQPVSGPYAPHRSDRGASGLVLRWLDTRGAELSPWDDPERLARVNVVARGRHAGLTGSRSVRPDSLSVLVTPRNR